MKAPAIFFTDLDGTLLDHETYSAAPARPALAALRQAGIPLVFCTSKTRLETERWRRALANVDPFIVENGGAVFVPEGSLGPGGASGPVAGGDRVLEFGRPYAEIRRAFEEIRASTGLPLRGFGDMTVDEIARRSGLGPADAALAARREYDEPFVGLEPGHAARVRQEAEARGLRIVAGGRFDHLIGGNDKGRAVRALRSLYEEIRGPVRTVGLGDSANDLPMLQAVDIAVVVPRPDGVRLESAGPAGAIVAPSPGPEGWRAAVLALLGRLA